MARTQTVNRTTEGMLGNTDVMDLLVHLVGIHPEISALKLFRTEYLPSIQEELDLSELERLLIGRALQRREELGLPFWDAVFVELNLATGDVPAFLKRVCRHNQQDARSIVISRDQCTQEYLAGLAASLQPSEILAISSEVRLRSGLGLHIPMVDFHGAESEGMLNVIRRVLQEVGLTGFILRSGRSYHFYGRILVTLDEMLDVLGKMLLFGPIVDGGWIAHQIIERACGLRLSLGKHYKELPTVVGEV
jgi:hypothetical protein